QTCFAQSLKERMTRQTLNLRLPSEVLEKVNHSLSLKDRAYVALVNNYLKGIERQAGCRLFTDIYYDSAADNMITAEDSDEDLIYITDNNREATSVQQVAEFFRHSSTHCLQILWGQMDEEVEKRFRIVFKTVKFSILNIKFTNENPGSIVSDLVRGRKHIEHVIIHWPRGVGSDFESAQRMLLDLPTMERCDIGLYSSNQPLLNDEVLLHLVENSCTTKIVCGSPAVTPSGLSTVFKMFRSSLHTKKAQFHIFFRTLSNFMKALNGTSYNVSGNEIVHRKSGATLRSQVEIANLTVNCTIKVILSVTKPAV
ncbi:hypothetical protein PENTCL1PPCAC_5318, partial [Pristionchus entomophagus]